MGWEIIYVLTMSYCISPPGKAACERTEDTYDFTVAYHCIQIRNELAYLYDNHYGNVILYPAESKCEARVQSAITTEDREQALSTGKERLAEVLTLVPYKHTK